MQMNSVAPMPQIEGYGQMHQNTRHTNADELCCPYASDWRIWADAPKYQAHQCRWTLLPLTFRLKDMGRCTKIPDTPIQMCIVAPMLQIWRIWADAPLWNVVLHGIWIPRKQNKFVEGFKRVHTFVTVRLCFTWCKELMGRDTGRLLLLLLLLELRVDSWMHSFSRMCFLLMSRCGTNIRRICYLGLSVVMLHVTWITWKGGIQCDSYVGSNCTVAWDWMWCRDWMCVYIQHGNSSSWFCLWSRFQEVIIFSKTVTDKDLLCEKCFIWVFCLFSDST